MVYGLWFIAEVAIAATDLAEVIGSAVALNLLFHIPIWARVLITGTDVLFIIAFGTKSFRFLEILIILLCAVRRMTLISTQTFRIVIPGTSVYRTSLAFHVLGGSAHDIIFLL